MKKQCLEIELSKGVDAFKVEEYLKRYKEISKVHSITCTSIRVWFNPDKIVAKKIMKLVQSFSGTSSNRGRKKNIRSIKQIEDAA